MKNFAAILILLCGVLASEPTIVPIEKWLNGPMFKPGGSFDSEVMLHNGLPVRLNKMARTAKTAMLSDWTSIAPVERYKPCGSGVQAKVQLDRSIDVTGLKTLHAIGIKGKGVVIGIYDSGIDWLHGDFIGCDGKTRVLYLWDQTLDTINGEHQPPYSNCKFGVEYTADDINKELNKTTSGKVRSKDPDSHGTHVAGIAASSGLARNSRTPTDGFPGAAPEASLIIVKGNYGDAATSAALDYMNKRATELGMPLSVNFSFGGQTGAHDGTSITEKKIDSLFNSNSKGRFIAVAAGNDNLDSLHMMKSFVTESTWEIPFSIKSYTPRSGQYNDAVAFSFWYPGGINNHINVSLYGPDANGNATRLFGPFQYRATNPVQAQLIDSLGYVEVYNAAQANGKDQILIYLVDSMVGARSIQPVAGNWKIVLTRTRTNTSAVMHGWYATHPESYDRASITARITGSDKNYSIVVPATSIEAMTVGGFISARNWRAASGDSTNYYRKDWPYYQGMDTIPDIGSLFPQSSNGPSVDNRMKPDITAPAEAVASAMSRDIGYAPGDLRHWDTIHVISDGTSMAAPHVAGAAALILSRNPLLDHVSIRNMLKQNARKDKYTGTAAGNVWGNGKLLINEAMVTVDGKYVPQTQVNTGLIISPNPFNPRTSIKFNALKGSTVTLSVYDPNGRLFDKISFSVEKEGDQLLVWNGEKRGIGKIASGVYLFIVNIGGHERKGKAILLR
ncbi:MAG: S8 family peptidase [Fibrobacteres bacterium]|nr:S8 family peptidase [Fibrobacterota bacterium]